mmetsp:Transcript_56476/g.115583  ORF Transcript_56476/g.115583 Transcript_56476/m.115583 type:complete len:195 (+) Transcript_56476:149-733(+)
MFPPTLFKAVLVWLVVISSMPSTKAVQCYHGLETVGPNSNLNTDAQYWQETTGQDTAAEPVNCTKRVGDGYDTCSIFCWTYEMLTSTETITRCRRFCMQWQECNETRYRENEKCDQKFLVPEGNVVLTDCSQKCAFSEFSNFLPTCDAAGGGGCCGKDEECTTGGSDRTGSQNLITFGGSVMLSLAMSWVLVRN